MADKITNSRVGRCICWVGICWIAWGTGLTWAIDEPSLVETSPDGVALPWEDFSDSAVEPPWLTGWVNAGYTGASVGSGRLIVQPRPNHLGDEFLLNQLVLNLRRDPDPQSDFWGFHMQLLAGSDAWLLAGPGDSDNTNMRFGFVVRQVHVDVHLDLLTEGGHRSAGRTGSLLPGLRLLPGPVPTVLFADLPVVVRRRWV